MLGGNQPPLPIVTGTTATGTQDAIKSSDTSASSAASPVGKKEKTPHVVEAQ